LLPALAFGEQFGLSVTVEHYDRPYWKTLASDEAKTGQPV
jgi:hypothetical protein